METEKTIQQSSRERTMEFILLILSFYRQRQRKDFYVQFNDMQKQKNRVSLEINDCKFLNLFSTTANLGNIEARFGATPTKSYKGV